MAAKTRGRRVVTRAHPQTTPKTPDRSTRSVALGTKHTGECPECGGADKLKVSTYTDAGGRSRWSVHCRSSECDPPGGDWLRELAELIGYTQTEILDDPLRCLDGYVGAETVVNAEPGPLASGDDIDRWCRMLHEQCPEGLDYLVRERGLTLKVIRSYELGYDGRSFTMPIYADGDFGGPRQRVQLKRRYWPTVPTGRDKYWFVRGRPAAWPYPDIPASGPLILVAGVFDALCLRSHGLPGVSIASGASTPWDSAWSVWWPPGRAVAVAYDVGEEAQANARVAELRVCGADAWLVRLAELDLPAKGDLTDALTGRYAPQELRAFINSERRVAA
jgi:hypothetical protein